MTILNYGHSECPRRVKRMNIYLLNEDDTFCVRAETMAQAVAICEASYLKERKEDEGEEYNEEFEKTYYHSNILQSCTLVAELRN